MPTLYLGRWIRGFGRFLKATVSLMDTSHEAQRRAQILTFWQKHGLPATRDAFRVSRSTLFAWQRRLQEGRGKLSSLEPGSRRPRRLRSMTLSPVIISRICLLRRSFPHYGPAKLRVLLKEEGLTASTSTIFKIIKRYQLPSAPRRYVARRKGKRKPRLPKGFEALLPGDLVGLDAVVLQESRRKLFLIVAIDHATRMAVARAYRTLSSRTAKDLLTRMQLLLGVSIRAVLTDNGSEFHAAFEQVCASLRITHYWTYPRSPKMNAVTERFNRTIQEEAHLPPFRASLQEWNAHIGHYVMQYNFHRPHQALSYRRPIDEYCATLQLTPSQSRMWAIHTRIRHA